MDPRRSPGSWDDLGAKGALVSSIHHPPLINKQGARSAGRFASLPFVLLAVWCLICCSCLVYTGPKLHGEHMEQLVLYFQPLVPISFMVWLWGYNVHQFENMDIPYDICFSVRDRRYLVPADDVFKVAMVVSAIVASGAAAFAYCCLHSLHAQYLPVLTYMALLLLLVAPVNFLHASARLFFSSTLRRTLMPLQEVTWSDFLLADVLTSLSKCFSDIAKAACGLAAGGPAFAHPTLQASDAAGSGGGAAGAGPGAFQCSPTGAHVLLALCLPYLIRFVQCIIVNRTTGNTSQIFNAIKYASAFPALILTALEHEHHVRGDAYPLRTWWLAAMFVNTLYSCYWDIEMDWDMPWLVQPGAFRLGPLRLPALKQGAIYAVPWYVWAVASNLLLRLAWAHRLLGTLENYVIVAMTIALLEAYRRYQWVYIRVETEIRKIKSRAVHEHVIDRDDDA